MATVELATSLAFWSNLSSSLLALEVLASQAFGFFVLDCSDCQIFWQRSSYLSNVQYCPFQIAIVIWFVVRLQCNLAKASIVNLSLPPQLSKDLRYLTNYEVCQIELALLTWLGWLVRVAGTVLGCDAKYWLRRHFPSLLAKDGLIKRKVLDSSPRYVPRALLLFYQK